MKIIKYFLFLILIVIIAVSIYVAIQPNDYEVTRTRTINTSLPIIYDNINDYKNWENWGPWQEEDPSMTFNYPENTVGEGAGYSWEGKDGKGKMETVSAIKNKSLDQKLTFGDFEPSDVYWRLKEVENGTEVTWGMKGNKNFFFKLYTTFAGSMEKNVGPMYERGLEKLDSVVIASTKKYSVEVNGITQHSGGFYIYNTASSKISELENKIPEMLPKVGMYAAKNKITTAGMPFIYYHEWDEENNATIFSSCIPTTEKVITNRESDILTGQIQSFTAVKATLKGDYSNMEKVWEAAIKYIQDNGLEETDGPRLEVFANDPGLLPNPADWITEIYIAVKSE
ncbi:transcription activator effector-binding protein [Flavobacteriaceae bacterium R38]|nr:transcription activator effector-binding protein [Flavobacteriaceae bacterium R38]